MFRPLRLYRSATWCWSSARPTAPARAHTPGADSRAHSPVARAPLLAERVAKRRCAHHPWALLRCTSGTRRCGSGLRVVMPCGMLQAGARAAAELVHARDTHTAEAPGSAAYRMLSRCILPAAPRCPLSSHLRRAPFRTRREGAPCWHAAWIRPVAARGDHHPGARWRAISGAVTRLQRSTSAPGLAHICAGTAALLPVRSCVALRRLFASSLGVRSMRALWQARELPCAGRRGAHRHLPNVARRGELAQGTPACS